jgi:hypothetical protein
MRKDRFDMHGRFLSVAVTAACLAACAGCGNSSGQYPVSGKVLHDGQPAAGATVTFIRKGVDPFKEPTPQGTVGDDGTFILTGPGGAGAAPGDYVVLVEWKEGAGAKRGRAPALGAPDRLKTKYLDPNKPQLTATVEPKSNSLPPFEVK